MEATFFGIKRIHLRTVEITKRLLVPSTLTPARFDMMRIVAVRNEGILQRNIQELLGVSAATVSRMLKALEKEGAIVRSRWPLDRRCLLVVCTSVGIDLVGRAFAETVDPRIAEHMAASLITNQQHPDLDDPEVSSAVADFEDRLVRARLRLRDRARVRHPWAMCDVAAMPDLLFTRNQVVPLFWPTYTTHEELFITSEGRALVWDPPPGYVPPPPDSYGLMPSPEDLGIEPPVPTEHRAHREKREAAAADLAQFFAPAQPPNALMPVMS